MYIPSWAHSEDLVFDASRKEEYEDAERLLKDLENPQKRYEVVQVTGTNGATTTSHFVADVLAEEGYDTGLFSSNLIYKSAQESYKVNGTWVKENTLEGAITRVLSLEPQTYRSAVIAVAHAIFDYHDVDIAVIEANLGGRNDVTNTVDCRVGAVTSIGTDHSRILGDSKEEIARKKVDIADENTTLIVNAPKLLDVCRKHVSERSVKVVEQKSMVKLQWDDTENRYGLTIGDETVLTPMIAEYLTENIQTASTVLKYSPWTVRDESIREVAREFLIPGRAEKRTVGTTYTAEALFDGAHNVQGVRTLTKTLKNVGEDFVCVFSSLETKNWKEMARLLEPHVSRFIITEIPNSRRATSLKELRSFFTHDIEKPFSCVRKECPVLSESMRRAEEQEIILVTGSLKLLKSVRPRWVSHRAE